jgi:hypothetical protein
MKMFRIIRVFPRKTKATPDDDLAYFDDPRHRASSKSCKGWTRPERNWPFGWQGRKWTWNDYPARGYAVARPLLFLEG